MWTPQACTQQSSPTGPASAMHGGWSGLDGAGWLGEQGGLLGQARPGGKSSWRSSCMRHENWVICINMLQTCVYTACV